jgi:CBS domain-containing protein
VEDDQETRLTDLRPYIDQVVSHVRTLTEGPIALSRNAPMELVFELFSKLGLRYLCIVDGGKYLGVVHKKMFLAYLKSLEKKS